jgi:hypothetical protein
MFLRGQRRTPSGFGARLAFLAIALQLVLSFGHIHPLPTQQAVFAVPPPSGGPDLPLAGDDCAICANITAFASLDLPQQAYFLPPATRAEILAPIAVATDFRPIAVRHFASRAPPSDV